MRYGPKLRVGLLKEGEGYSGLNVRAKPGGTIVGALAPGINFYLTGKTVKHQIEWVEGDCDIVSGHTTRHYIGGWVARSWLDIHDVEPQKPGPVNVPCDVEIPARYDGLGLFRSWPEAIVQGGIIVIGGTLLAWWIL